MVKKLKKVNSNNNLIEDLRSNDLVTIDSLNDDCLIHIFEYLPICDRIRLERVNKRWRAVSQVSWSSFKTLDFSRELGGISKDKWIDNTSLAKILKKCGRYLIDLQMENVKENSSRRLLNIDYDLFELTPNLKSVGFEWTTFNLENMQIFVKHCKNIETISFMNSIFGWGASFIDQVFKETIFRKYKKLKSITLFDCPIIGTCLETICTENIEELLFIRNFYLIPYLIVDFISKCHKLKKLCFILEEFEIDSLILPESLQSLNISENYFAGDCINDNYLQNLSKSCPNLSTLNLSGIYDRVTDTGLAYIALLPKLEHLCVGDMDLITGQSLTNMPRLKTLSCARSGKIVPKYMENVLKVSDQLESLNLTGCSMIDKKFITNVITYLETRKNGIILTLVLRHIDPYPVQLPCNLKLILGEEKKGK